MHHHHHNHHRRRKKRPNYGTRTVDVCRGLNGFGFTISGQQPCILSCIVANSPADMAGLRAGNFLISVNGLNVSKLPHEAVVQLIGNSSGNIKMTIAENYYSDSSDEDNILVQQNYHRIRHKYPNQSKFNGTKNHHRNIIESNIKSDELEHVLIPSRSHNVILTPNASNSKDITNVSAMVRVHQHLPTTSSASTSPSNSNIDSPNLLEYRAIVGYLGTIEMPKQIATSSKLQTVRSCIRKMRQEKRNPTNVLMTILPNQLTLKNNNNTIIAKYPSSRLNYVSSSSENNDNKFFGLVTSQIYTEGGQIFNDNDAHDIITRNNDVNISNSCHVFVIDTKLCDHLAHIDKAEIFKIVCTKDPISNLCLEFPNNSEYVVNLIRSMYTLKSAVKLNEKPNDNPKVQNNQRLINHRIDDHNFNDLIISNSPQPSEITTTSSNSDSGIGFHNDLSNISDRIVVVDFPRQNNLHCNANNVGIAGKMPLNNNKNPRPLGIINDLPLINIRAKPQPVQNSRLTVRAMPDPKVNLADAINLPTTSTHTTYDDHGNLVQERPVDVPKIYETIFYNPPSLQNSRSCDDIMIGYSNSMLHDDNDDGKLSIDAKFEKNVLIDDDHVFVKPLSIKKQPNKNNKMTKKQISTDDSRLGLSTKVSDSHRSTDKLLSYKLSPKVFGVSRPISISYENLVDSGSKQMQYIDKDSTLIADNDGGSVWGSLQELRMQTEVLKPMQNMLEGTYSEPDLRDDESNSGGSSECSRSVQNHQCVVRISFEFYINASVSTWISNLYANMAASQSEANINCKHDNKSLVNSKFHDIKFVFNAIVPNRMKLLNTTSSSNNNSFDQSLEYKPIVRGKSDGDVIKNLKQKLWPSHISADGTLCGSTYQNTSISDSAIYDKNYVELTNSDKRIFLIGDHHQHHHQHHQYHVDFKKLLGNSSTPNKKITSTQPYKLNLLTPPSDTMFIDSDFESMDQDRYDNSIGGSRSTISSIEDSLKIIDENTVIECNNNEVHKPVVKLKRNRRLLNIFSSGRRKKYRSVNNGCENECENHRYAPLTRENIARYCAAKLKLFASGEQHDDPIEWGANYDFSFSCEPPTSDTEANNSFDTNNSSGNVVSKQFVIPTFKIDAAPPSEYKLEIKTASIASALRRSMSDPNYLQQISSGSDKSLSPSVSDIESDCDLLGVMESALLPEINRINCANVKNLETISSRSLNPATTTTSISSSPFRSRWGQSSLRSRTVGDIRGVQLNRRPSSLAASESDVYTKSEQSGSVHNSSNLLKNHHNSNSSASCCDSNSNLNEIHGNGMIDTSNGKLGPSTWNTSFEKLLSDSAGIHTFSEFLKKEFSAENIYFWTACERYSKIGDYSERRKEAVSVFLKHLATGAPEPVNVDSQARNTTQENLPNAEKNLLLPAQKQIFNLMKFDSYPRFLKSDLYRQCVEAEEKHHPLPYPGGEHLDILLKTGISSPTQSKLKKSLSNADDRRRKSLLPWHRKARCKSKDREDLIQQQKTNNGNLGNNNINCNGLKIANSGSDIHSSRSSLSSFDAAFSSRSNIDSEENRGSLCRVLLSDGASTIVLTRQGESVRELVERLLEKRGICYQAYEAFLFGNNKPIDLDSPSTCLAGKEVQIEQRVIFKLDLPNRKVISVKSKPCKALGEVLRPILHKYNFKLDLVQVFFRESSEPLDMTLPVTVTDGQRLQVVCKPADIPVAEITQISTTASLNVGNPIQKVQKTVINSNSGPIQPGAPGGVGGIAKCSQNLITFNKNVCNKTTQTQQSTLDEITNKVFNELLQGKVDSHLTQLPPQPSDQGSTKSEDWGSEASSGIFGRLRINRADPNYRLNKIKKSTIGIGGGVPIGVCVGLERINSTTCSEDGNDGNLANINNNNIHNKDNNNTNNNVNNNNSSNNNHNNNNLKKPLIAKWKAGVKLQVTARSENHDLLEGLKRAQRSRLEDQRGTEINFELPDFLKDKENNLNNNKLRKLKENSSAQTTATNKEPVPFVRSIIDDGSSSSGGGTNTNNNLAVSVRPQPAPRLSINSKTNNTSSTAAAQPISLPSIRDELNSLDTTLLFQHHNHPVQKTEYHHHHHPHNQTAVISPNNNNMDDKSSTHSSCFNSDNQMDSSFNSIGIINHNSYDDGGNGSGSCYDGDGIIEDEDCDGLNQRGPPPLPPKPKILPIKPSNWGQNNNNPQEMPRRPNTTETKSPRNVYLDQPSSSFV